MELRYGVMVALQILVLPVQVRILISQHKPSGLQVAFLHALFAPGSGNGQCKGFASDPMRVLIPATAAPLFRAFLLYLRYGIFKDYYETAHFQVSVDSGGISKSSRAMRSCSKHSGRRSDTTEWVEAHSRRKAALRTALRWIRQVRLPDIFNER